MSVHFLQFNGRTVLSGLFVKESENESETWAIIIALVASTFLHFYTFGGPEKNKEKKKDSMRASDVLNLCFKWYL